MKTEVSRGLLLFLCITLVSWLPGKGTFSAAPPKELSLERQLVAFLESGKTLEDIRPEQSLSPLSRYPILATTAYIALEKNPPFLEKHYPAIARLVLDRFQEGNLTSSGLIRGASVPASGAVYLSPAMNGLAAIELHSLHLIAWRVGAYEDALAFRQWSNKLSETVTRTFFDPMAGGFYPVDGDYRFVPILSPGELLPIVTDRTLGQTAGSRVPDAFAMRSGELSKAGSNPFSGELWDDPLLQPTVLDLLSNVIDPGSKCFEIMAASVSSESRATGPGRPAWINFWRGNPPASESLFPSWRVISALVNLTLLFERESLLMADDFSRLKAGVDSLAAALASGPMTLDSYAASISTANGLLTHVAHISALLASNRDRARIANVLKWNRLSPRTRRLIQEACSSSIDDLARAKAELSKALAAGTGISLDVEFPREPIPLGRAVDFVSRLSSSRETLRINGLVLQIGEKRWKLMEPEPAVALVPGGTPYTYAETLALPPSAEPGIVTLPLFADFLCAGRRIELWRIESVALVKGYDVTFDLREGRRIGDKPVPLDITVWIKPDHDRRGTVEGTFLRELSTTPSLPARFHIKGGSEHTNLTVEISSRGTLSPGRYPFTVTVSLDGRALGHFEDYLVRPFRWLQFGPLPASEKLLENGLRFQEDLLKTYTVSSGRTVRWQPVPSDATDSEGVLRLRRVREGAPSECALLYTAVDAPARMRLLWRLRATDAVSLWVNSKIIISEGDNHEDDMKGSIELRKGPNSFLLAVRRGQSTGRISFELSDENGLPPIALSNEMEDIIDGYEEIAGREEPKPEEGSPADRLREATLTFTNAEATEVSVIGSFNNWEPGVTPMRKTGASTWTARLFLAPGRYPYKLLINRKLKVVDPTCPVTEPDGFGGSNSVLEVR